MALVTELQKKAIGDESIGTLLRMCLFTAAKLNIQDTITWVKNELHGYASDEVVPNYRVSVIELKGYNPYHGWQPIVIDNPDISKQFSQTNIIQPISDIESLLTNYKGQPLMMTLTHDVQLMVMQMIKHNTQIRLFVPQSTLKRICDALKTLVLEWSLELEKQGILGEGQTFSEEEMSIAKNNQNIHINNFQGVMGDVTSSDVNQNLNMDVRIGNMDELTLALRKLELPEQDIDELKSAIQDDGSIENSGTFGTKVNAWISKMVEKALSGSCKIAAETAVAVLTDYLKKYYMK